MKVTLTKKKNKHSKSSMIQRVMVASETAYKTILLILDG
ncbi:hypothetical protein BTN49_0428 [Candidatus Enterovibrio escicola]|uniref:Uncharacterized protein n=1 Tax=Candidatus Enterovibrio escicola TaxID=1927127 RepID=A0A2A5T5S7_9GAMM|nr:hypothetical protein BTN49_0428 [Candidatus Enterovibrio escacola]